jgi:hypothetical protein
MKLSFCSLTQTQIKIFPAATLFPPPHSQPKEIPPSPINKEGG